MNCPNCKTKLKKVEVSIEGAKNKAVSYQCPKCDYYEFEKESSAKVVKELKLNETPLKIRHKIIKLSKDRIGIYFNQNIVRSLGLEAGEELFVSVPDKKHMVIKLGV